MPQSTFEVRSPTGGRLPWEPALLFGALIVTPFQPGAVISTPAVTTTSCASEASIVVSSPIAREPEVLVMVIDSAAADAMDAASDEARRRLELAYDAAGADWEFAG